jgi:hypothetical protein
VRPQHPGRVGDHHRGAGLLVAAGHQLGGDLGAGVRTHSGTEPGAGGQPGRGGRPEHADAGHVDDRVQPLAMGGAKDDVGAAGVGVGHDGGAAGIQRVHAGGVHHRVAAAHRLLDRGWVGDVADHGVDPGDAQRAEGGRDPLRVADQQPDLVAVVEQRGHGVAADKPGPAGDQYTHRVLPSASAPPRTGDLVCTLLLAAVAASGWLGASGWGAPNPGMRPPRTGRDGLRRARVPRPPGWDPAGRWRLSRPAGSANGG